MPYSAKLQDAVALALELHRDQTRKGGAIPYVEIGGQGIEIVQPEFDHHRRQAARAGLA